MKAYYAAEILAGRGPVRDAWLLVQGGTIAGLAKEPPAAAQLKVYDGCTLAPGFIDVHTHGAMGYETGFGDARGLAEWARFQLSRGVTGFLPSTASIPLERMAAAAEDVRRASSAPRSIILGLHLEGPFFSPGGKAGAQNPRYLQAEFTADFRDFIMAYRDVIRYMAVDPALAAAEEIAPFCARLGIRVAAAHSDISYQDFLGKKALGFAAVTHTFNGMSGLDHRRPGLAYAACLDRDLYAEIICDGHHVCYPMIDLFLRLKGRRKAVLITDSVSATGMEPGAYTLGDLAVRVTPDGRVTKADGGLAGSTLTLDKAVRNLVQTLHLPVAEAVYMASTAPARLLGLRSKGRLSPGKDADFIVLDAGLKVAATYLRGEEAFAAG